MGSISCGPNERIKKKKIINIFILNHSQLEIVLRRIRKAMGAIAWNSLVFNDYETPNNAQRTLEPKKDSKSQ